MIEEHQTTIVFTNTRTGTENVVYKLKERGLESIEAHHGSLAKETRLDVEERLKNGQLRCVVSSTSLELGIDIGFVDLVCQIGSPKTVAKGLQRIGRSGHSHGKTSKGRMMVFELDDLVECAVLCRAAHRSQHRPGHHPGELPGRAGAEHRGHVAGEALGGGGGLSRWCRRSYCYRNLSRESFLEVLRYLGSKDAFEGVYSKIWYDEDGGRFGKKKGGRMIYFLNLGTIPEEANYKVFTETGRLRSATSPRSSWSAWRPGTSSCSAARSLRVRPDQGDEGLRQSPPPGASPPCRPGPARCCPAPSTSPWRSRRFRREMAAKLDEPRRKIIAWLVNDFDIDNGSARSILSYFREQKAAVDLIPNDRRLAIEGYIDMAGNRNIIFHFPFGRRVNDALSRAYAFQVTPALWLQRLRVGRRRRLHALDPSARSSWPTSRRC